MITWIIDISVLNVQSNKQKLHLIRNLLKVSFRDLLELIELSNIYLKLWILNDIANLLLIIRFTKRGFFASKEILQNNGSVNAYLIVSNKTNVLWSPDLKYSYVKFVKRGSNINLRNRKFAIFSILNGTCFHSIFVLLLVFYLN